MISIKNLGVLFAILLAFSFGTASAQDATEAAKDAKEAAKDAKDAKAAADDAAEIANDLAEEGEEDVSEDDLEKAEQADEDEEEEEEVAKSDKKDKKVKKDTTKKKPKKVKRKKHEIKADGILVVKANKTSKLYVDNVLKGTIKAEGSKTVILSAGIHRVKLVAVGERKPYTKAVVIKHKKKLVIKM
jgi:hypothetical protein